MVTFSKALQRPFQDPNWAINLFIGGAILAIGNWIRFPYISFIVFGYVYRCYLEHLEEGRFDDVTQGTLPKWSVGRIVDGVYATVGLFLIYIIPILIFWAVFPAGNSFFGVFFKLVVFCLFFVALFFTPIIMARFAKTGRLGSVFEFKPMFHELQLVFSEYLIAFMATGLIWVLARGIPGKLTALFSAPVHLIEMSGSPPKEPSFFSIGLPFITFFLMIVFTYIFADICRGAMGRGESATAGKPEPQPLTPPPAPTPEKPPEESAETPDTDKPEASEEETPDKTQPEPEAPPAPPTAETPPEKSEETPETDKPEASEEETPDEAQPEPDMTGKKLDSPERKEQIEALAGENPDGISAKDIAELLDVSQSQAQRIIKAFADSGFLEKKGRKYKLTDKQDLTI